MAKQPEERNNLHTSIKGSILTSAAGRTSAAGFPIAASGKAIGDSSSTKMASAENSLLSYVRKSSSLSDQTPTSRMGDMPRK